LSATGLNVWNYLNAMPVASPLENIQFVKEFQQAEVYTHARSLSEKSFFS